MAESVTSLERRPTTSLLAEAAGEHLPSYVTREQARAIINAAETMTHRLLLECLWQSGGRVSEVLRLRPCDVDHAEGALWLGNLKQKGQLGHARIDTTTIYTRLTDAERRRLHDQIVW